MARSTTRQTMARERARAARLRIDAERAKRDENIEEHAAAFFDALDARAALLAEVEDCERVMGRAILDLLGLDEPRGRVADLLEINGKELRRLLEPIETESAISSATPVAKTNAVQQQSSQPGPEHGTERHDAGAEPASEVDAA